MGEQVAAGLYGTYIAADGAYVGALAAGKVTKAQLLKKADEKTARGSGTMLKG